MWLTTIPFAQRVWALPFWTALAPAARYYQARGRTPKTITDGARQLMVQLRRWLPDQARVMTGDSAYAALDFLHACAVLQHPVTLITRLRLDAALSDPPPPYKGRGRPRKKGARRPTPQQYIDDPSTAWQRLTRPWYDQRPRELDIATGTAFWFHFGLPGVSIR